MSKIALCLKVLWRYSLIVAKCQHILELYHFLRYGASPKKIYYLAQKTFKLLGCSGISRIDFLIDEETNKVYVNEINTIPGSLSFYLWEPLGMKYEHLLDNMIQLALKADRESHKVVYSFETNVLEGVKLGGGSKGSKMWE